MKKLKLAPNGLPLREESRKLADICKVSYHTCLNWLEGKDDGEKTIVGWMVDDLLSLMVYHSEGKPCSLREISEFTGLTHQRIEQIEKQALRKVRSHHHTKEILRELNQ